jgi:hypothetical protein
VACGLAEARHRVLLILARIVRASVGVWGETAVIC